LSEIIDLGYNEKEVKNLNQENRISELHFTSGEIILIDGSLEQIVKGDLQDVSDIIVPGKKDPNEPGMVATSWVHNSYILAPSPASTNGHLRIFPHAVAVTFEHPYKTQEEKENILGLFIK
jgi:hypothetical protein